MDSLFSNPLLVFVGRILLSILCGSLIGLERTKRSKEAGIRTHAIIAMASALIMILSKYGFTDLAAVKSQMGTNNTDPARLAAQIVTGIGFLGTGVIFKNGSTVKGLTTAAGIWATSAVGMACGAGLWQIAIIASLLLLGIQLVMHRFSVGNDAFSNTEIRIVFDDTPEMHELLRKKQEELDINIVNSRISRDQKAGTIDMILFVRMRQHVPFEECLAFLEQNPGIHTLHM